jgi:hypothetical protein
MVRSTITEPPKPTVDRGDAQSYSPGHQLVITGPPQTERKGRKFQARIVDWGWRRCIPAIHTPEYFGVCPSFK